MSGIERLRKEIIEHAERKAREIVESAEKEAEKIIENAKKEAERIKRGCEEKARKEGERVKREKIAVIKEEYRKKLLEKEKELRERILSIVLNNFINIDSKKRERLFKSILDSLKDDVEKIVVAERDEKIVKKLVKNCEVEKSNEISAGFIAVCREKEYNFTFERLFEIYRKRIYGEIR
jgi:V/A-type H+-transporting ATPase subunit E